MSFCHTIDTQKERFSDVFKISRLFCIIGMFRRLNVVSETKVNTVWFKMRQFKLVSGSFVYTQCRKIDQWFRTDFIMYADLSGRTTGRYGTV